MEVSAMASLLLSNLNASHDQEIAAPLPESFTLMMKIQQEAEAEFKVIVDEIKAGRTTLEAVKRERGLIS